MPTDRRLDSILAGSGGDRKESGVVAWSAGDLVLKKEVICRWEGSEAAPAKGRLTRGVDMVEDYYNQDKNEKWKMRRQAAGGFSRSIVCEV